MEFISGWDKALFREVSSRKDSSGSESVKRKLERIKRKLLAGVRLTAEEKAFLREHAPNLYEEAMAMERERAAYEERLKKCRTKEEAERIKTEKMMEEAAQEEDAEAEMMRMAQTKAAEEDAASAVAHKPSRIEGDNGHGRAEPERQEAGKARDGKKADGEGQDRERTDRERWQDRYYGEQGRQKEQEEHGTGNESGFIYRRTGHPGAGKARPLPKGMHQQAAFGSGQEGRSMEMTGDGGTVQTAGTAEQHGGFDKGYARGYAAYQAVLQEEAELAGDFSVYEIDE